MPFARLQDDGRAARETTPQQPQHYRYTDSRATMWAGDSFVVLMSASSLHVGRHLNYRMVTVLKGALTLPPRPVNRMSEEGSALFQNTPRQPHATKGRLCL